MATAGIRPGEQMADPSGSLVICDGSATLAAARGEVVLLSGSVASGKSMWLLRLAGIQPFSTGVRCQFDGLPWPASSSEKLRMLPDGFDRLWLGSDVGDELGFGLKPRPSDQHMRQMLDAWRVPGLALNASLQSLNRLHALRVALAALTLAKPAIMLLDNPTAALPVEDGALLRQDVRAWARQAGMVVVAACNRWQDWQNDADQRWQCSKEGNMPVKMSWEESDDA
jgi:ABC-2 type transport system ATP-binding protein